MADVIHAMNEVKIKLNHVHLPAIILGSNCMFTNVWLSGCSILKALTHPCEELGITVILEQVLFPQSTEVFKNGYPKRICVFQRHRLLSWICKTRILKASQEFHGLKFLLGGVGDQLLSKFFIALHNLCSAFRIIWEHRINFFLSIVFSW